MFLSRDCEANQKFRFSDLCFVLANFKLYVDTESVGTHVRLRICHENHCQQSYPLNIEIGYKKARSGRVVRLGSVGTPGKIGFRVDPKQGTCHRINCACAESAAVIVFCNYS